MLPRGRLGCWRENNFGQFFRFFQSGGQLDAAHHAGHLVILPARTDDVTAHHRFYHQWLEFTHDHRAAGDLFALIRRHHRLRRDAGQVVRYHVAEFLEPVVRHRGQHFALARNRVRQDDVECRQAVALYDQQFIVADGVDIAHFPAMQKFKAFQVGFKQRCVAHGVL